MTDTISKEMRSRIMSRSKSSGTNPELIVSEIIQKLKLQYKVNDRELPGAPDFSFPKLKCVIFDTGKLRDKLNKGRINGKLNQVA